MICSASQGGIYEFVRVTDRARLGVHNTRAVSQSCRTDLSTTVLGERAPRGVGSGDNRGRYCGDSSSCLPDQADRNPTARLLFLSDSGISCCVVHWLRLDTRCHRAEGSCCRGQPEFPWCGARPANYGHRASQSPSSAARKRRPDGEHAIPGVLSRPVKNFPQHRTLRPERVSRWKEFPMSPSAQTAENPTKTPTVSAVRLMRALTARAGASAWPEKKPSVDVPRTPGLHLGRTSR